MKGERKYTQLPFFLLDEKVLLYVVICILFVSEFVINMN